MGEVLDNNNFLLFAAKNYDNPQCFDDEEFYEDLKKFKYIKRLFNRYQETGDLKERLILNHIIVLMNMFGPGATVRMLFLKMKGFEIYLKPFLVYLNVLPDVIHDVGRNGPIYISSFGMDAEIVRRLRTFDEESKR